MTTATLHPLAADYLRRLEREARARRLPRSERRELLDEIGAHLSEAITPDMTEAQALGVIERLGQPEDIIEAELPGQRLDRDRRGVHEWGAIFLTLFGGFLFAVGWIAGVILLWSSRAWTLRDKLIGTLIVPGGLATVPVVALIVATKQTCTSFAGGPARCSPGPGTLHQIVSLALLACLILGPICTSVYLARRAR